MPSVAASVSTPFDTESVDLASEVSGAAESSTAMKFSSATEKNWCRLCRRRWTLRPGQRRSGRRSTWAPLPTSIGTTPHAPSCRPRRLVEIVDRDIHLVEPAEMTVRRVGQFAQPRERLMSAAVPLKLIDASPVPVPLLKSRPAVPPKVSVPFATDSVT